MGMFDFVKNVGKKLGIGDDDGTTDAPAKAAVQQAPKFTNAQVIDALTRKVNALELPIEGLVIGFNDGVAVVNGETASQETAEKVVLTIGNASIVGQVDDRIEVEVPAPPAVFHTVAKGDTLSKISKAQYGVIFLYEEIFAANQPLIKHVDEIFPGQVLRIPLAPDAPQHTVKGGDTLGKIAKHYYGDASKYTVVFDANTDQLDDPNKISKGQVLTIPLLRTPGAAQA